MRGTLDCFLLPAEFIIFLCCLGLVKFNTLVKSLSIVI